ncbi:ribonuclease H-like domain, reverse transcriptase, RNA-dependent DNA polymerase [Tanacetum coccineum]
MVEVILFYNRLEVLTRQILDSNGAIPTKTAVDAKTAIQEMAEYSQKWHNGTSRTRSTETSDGLAPIQAKLNNLRREIKKVNEKVYVAQVGCKLCKGPYYTKDYPLKEEGKTLEEAYYTQFGVPFQQGWQYRAAALGFYQRNNANPSYQEPFTDAAIRNQGALIRTLEIQIGKMSKVLQERGSERSTRFVVSAQQNSKLIFEPRQATIPFPSHLYNDWYEEEKGSYGLKDLDAYSIETTLRSDALPQKEKDPGSFTLPCDINNNCFEKALADLGASVSFMPLSTYLNLGLGELAHTKLTVELADRIVKHPKGIAENVLVGISKFVFLVDFIILDMPEDINVPLILERPFLSTAHAKVDVFKRKINLRVGDEKIIFKSVKPASSLIKRVYMLSLRERVDLDLEARLMGETLILNRSFYLSYGDYIELNDLNEPLELKINRVDDLEPTIKEGKVVNEPVMGIVKTRCNFVGGLDDYPSSCDFDRRIHIDCAYNLKFSCMMGFDYVEYNGCRSIIDDDGMGDVIVGEPFCKASCVEARRFDGIVTIRDGDESVTYQIVRSDPMFKHLTNEKCNKIPPLLKVSEQDKMNGIYVDPT